MARNPGVQDGIMRCSECGGPMVKLGHEYRCIDKLEPEELVAVGFIPSKDAAGKLSYENTALDQQRIQASQAYTNSVEIDDAYLQSLGLDAAKIRQYQLKHDLVP
ncbi:MAG TPA: hypothetical protein VLR94_04620 [Acidobacteriota bacterium]|nr:hypothetical protein [Acidobacteriota bacterium]